MVSTILRNSRTLFTVGERRNNIADDEVTRRLEEYRRVDEYSHGSVESMSASFYPPPGLNNIPAAFGIPKMLEFAPAEALQVDSPRSNMRSASRYAALEVNHQEESKQQRSIEVPQPPAEDSAWILPTNIDWVVAEYSHPAVKFTWYDLSSNAEALWKLAGRRGLGNTDIMKNNPVRCRTHYDPNLPVNVIDRRILSNFEIKKFGNPLPAGCAEARGRSRIIVQVPWRRYEFYRAQFYVEIDVRVRAGFTVPKVGFLVLEENQAQVILGAPFCEQLFFETRYQDQVVALKWGTEELEVPSNVSGY